MLRRMSAADKVAGIVDMVATAQALLLAGLQRRYPGLSTEDERARLVELWLGSALAPQVAHTYQRPRGSRQGKETGVRTPLEVLLRVIDVLDTLAIPYLLGGSWASMTHGVPRATQDADLLVQLEAAAVTPLVAALEDAFYVSEEAVRDAV